MGKMEFAFSEHRQHVGGLSGMMIAKSLEPSTVEARLDLPPGVGVPFSASVPRRADESSRSSLG